jgi:protein-S-isoprenylcysteine O-methyltransferase Ste14
MAPSAVVQRTAVLACATESRLLARLPKVLTNVSVAVFFSIFVISSWQFLWQTGSPVGLAAVVSNTILVACFLARRDPVAVSSSTRHWLVAFLTQLLPLLFRPAVGTGWFVALVSSAGQLAGLVLMGASLLALNRSIGIVAANRGVKTSGPYAWVRHPLYAGEITFFVSFLLGSFTTVNALLVLLLGAGQLTRISQEEALLLQDDLYQRYRRQVPCRLIPRVF